MHVGQLSGAGVRRSVLVFGVLLVHSLPEGFAIGTAFASETEGLGLFVILAIALQNMPGGNQRGDPDGGGGLPRRASSSGPRCSRALPSRSERSWHTLLVQEIEGLLPFSFAFAAGAMLCLVAVELAPGGFQARRTLRALARRDRGRRAA